MDWKDIAGSVGKFAPVVGTLLGGPAGAIVGAVGSIVASSLGVEATPEAVDQALKTNPEAALKLAAMESDERIKLRSMALAQAQAELEAEARAASSVNETMRSEVAAEHWPSYSWRPAIGFAVAFAVVLCVLAIFMAYGAAIFTSNAAGLQHLPGIIGSVAALLAVVTPILGIASWYRGKMQADPTIPTVNRG